MVSRFKRCKHFLGKTGQDIKEHKTNYIEAAMNYGLNQDQKLRFFHNLFNSKAKQFYRKYVQSICSTYEEACGRVWKVFSSIERQNKVLKHPQNLSIAAITETKACNVSEALEELREVISKYASQGPETHKSRKNRVGHLNDAIIRVE